MAETVQIFLSTVSKEFGAYREPLSRRTVEIVLAFTAQIGHQHPHLRSALQNYFSILLDAGRDEASARAEIDALFEKYGVALEWAPSSALIRPHPAHSVSHLLPRAGEGARLTRPPQ